MKLPPLNPIHWCLSNTNKARSNFFSFFIKINKFQLQYCSTLKNSCIIGLNIKEPTWCTPNSSSNGNKYMLKMALWFGRSQDDKQTNTPPFLIDRLITKLIYCYYKLVVVSHKLQHFFDQLYIRNNQKINEVLHSHPPFFAKKHQI